MFCWGFNYLLWYTDDNKIQDGMVHMKIYKAVKAGWKRLPVRLLTLILLMVLPINVISIVVSGIVFFNSVHQIKDSYQRELDGGLTYFLNLIEDMDHYYDSFVTEYLEDLTISTTPDGDNMDCYEMLSSLKTIFDYANFDGVFYIYDRENDRVYFKYNSDRYTVNEVEAMKRKLEKLEEISDSRKDWGLEHLGHYYFVSRTNKYTNYQIGLYIDIEQSLEGTLGQLATEGTEVYMKYKDHMLKFADGGLVFVENPTWDEVFEKSWYEKNVFWISDNHQHEVGVLIPWNKYFAGTQILYIVLFFVAIGGILLLFGMWKMLDRRVLVPLYRLDCGMQEVEKENFTFRIEQTDKNETIDFQYLYDSFNHMMGEVEASREKEKKMYETELDNLKLQVNPHMLLNSFNMIYSLAQTKNYEYIQRYSLLLVEYFRYVLRESNNLVLLKKEMNFVINYVEIQKIRFPNTFSFVYQVDEEVLDALVPPLLIQNFVENSMKYGLIPGKSIEILINVRKKENRMFISVTDTGRGMNEEVLEKISNGEVYLDKRGEKHIGIWNCRRRMEVFYGSDTKFSIVSKPEEGTQVWIEIPLISQSKEKEDGR